MGQQATTTQAAMAMAMAARRRVEASAIPTHTERSPMTIRSPLASRSDISPVQSSRALLERQPPVPSLQFYERIRYA